MRFDAIFFDSGGTLFRDAFPAAIPDPTPQEVLAGGPARAAALLNAFGYPVSEDLIARTLAELEGMLARRLGHAYTLDKLIQALYQALGLPECLEEVLCVADAYAGPRYRSWLFPDIHDTMDRIRAAGIYVGLIANTGWPGWLMDRALRGVSLLDYFGVRVYSGDEGIAKPDPNIFHLAAKRAAVSGKRLLYMGDKVEYDVLGATKAGWHAVLFRSSATTSGGLAEFEIDAWSELLELLLS